MAHRTDIKDQLMERPSEEEVQSTAERTKAALEKLVNGKIKAAQPKNVPNTQGELISLVLPSGERADRVVVSRCRRCLLHAVYPFNGRWNEATYHQDG